MTKFNVKKWFLFITTTAFLLVFLTFYYSQRLYQRTENSVSHISQIPYIGEHLKEIDSKGNVQYVHKKTFGKYHQILFTGYTSKENIDKLLEDGQWYCIAAVHVKMSLVGIHKVFEVSEKDYPISCTEEDLIIDTPSIQNTKIMINYMPSTSCFTGKAMINEHRKE